MLWKRDCYLPWTWPEWERGVECMTGEWGGGGGGELGGEGRRSVYPLGNCQQYGVYFRSVFFGQGAGRWIDSGRSLYCSGHRVPQNLTRFLFSKLPVDSFVLSVSQPVAQLSLRPVQKTGSSSSDWLTTLKSGQKSVLTTLWTDWALSLPCRFGEGAISRLWPRLLQRQEVVLCLRQDGKIA